MNKICFLDFDGVLNSTAYIKQLGDKWTGGELDPVAVELLNDIVIATKAKIVITSTWRLYSSIQRLTEILEFYGFIGDVVGKTIDLDKEYKYSRGYEINDYLRSAAKESQRVYSLDEFCKILISL